MVDNAVMRVVSTGGVRPEPHQDERVRSLLNALVRRLHELEATTLPVGVPVLDLQELGIRCLLLRGGQSGGDQVELLSPREREIAWMVSLGHTNKTIATVLEISLYTVSAHLRRIFAKLGVSTRAAMVAVLSGNQHLIAAARTVAEIPVSRVSR